MWNGTLVGMLKEWLSKADTLKPLYTIVVDKEAWANKEPIWASEVLRRFRSDYGALLTALRKGTRKVGRRLLHSGSGVRWSRGSDARPLRLTIELNPCAP